MSITFNQSPIITSGSLPLASHMAGLATAINSRLKSGVADCTKRIHQYVFNNYRQFRNPDTDDNFPSLGEFSMFYQMVEPEVASYPLADAGENEGANIACPANQFVFGVGDETSGTPGEGDSLTTYDFFKPITGTDPVDYWELAKTQRGAYDPSTGDQYTPMLTLAQRHFRLTFPDWSRHHKSPGGYLPTSTKADTDCYETDPDTGFNRFWTSYIIKFEPITEGYEPYTGSGTCGPDFGGSDSDVSFVANYPFAWYVYQFDGNVYRFDKSNYRQVLDGGGFPQREDGGQIQRLMVNPFISEFRGTEFQRNQTCFDNPYIEYSFANEDFYTSQYQLAPASGSATGDTINAIYPSWMLTTTQLSGSSTSVSVVNDGFRVGGHLIQQDKLASDVIIQLMQNSSVIYEFTCSKSTGSKVEIFPNGPNSGNIRYRFKNDLTFTDSSGYLYLEQSVLLDSKPEIWDGYALIRMASAKGAIGDENVDTRGTDWDRSREISDNYFRYGCMLGLNNQVSVEQQTAAVSSNPVFDAGRRYVNSFTRTINCYDMQLTSRPLIVGYEVSSSKSVLYFNRYQSAVGLTSQNIDLFSGIVNATDSASNGIITTAEKQGYTNEWLMELCGKPYKDSEDSIFKPAVYANYFPYINRCHLAPDDYELGPVHGKNMFRYVQENSIISAGDLRNKLYFPESLTAYNYDYVGRNPLNKIQYDDPSDVNGINAKRFYQSCQVYPKPYEIESVVVQPDDIVRIAFTTRFQHCEEAPETIANNVGSWIYADVVTEPYRTDENIVRLFLLHNYNSSNNPSQGIGDCSANSALPFSTINPYASIFPTFFFTKLIPKPYANTGIEHTGSLDYSGSLPRAYDLTLCETYIRSICEGFVDETLSLSNACQTDFSTDFDYTFANLCYDAFGKSWISNITGSIRDDYPLTYGPLPDMAMNTQVFNQLSKCVNKLTRARIPLPFKILARYNTYRDSTTATPIWPDGVTCDAQSLRAVVKDFTPAEPVTLVSTTDWMDIGNGTTATVGLTSTCGDGGSFIITTEKTKVELTFDTVDPLAWYAISEDLRSLTSGSSANGAVFTQDTTFTHNVDMELTADPNLGCADQENWFRDDLTGLYYNNITPDIVTNIECTYHDGSEEIDPGSIGINDLQLGSYNNPSVGGLEPCNDLPWKSKEIQVRNTRHMIVTIPTI